MIRQLLTLILIVSIVSSASFAQAPDLPRPVLVDRNNNHLPDKAIKLTRRENKLRRGNDAEFAVALSPSSPNCVECLPTLFEEGDQPILKSLKLSPSKGFSVRYGTDDARKFERAQQGESVHTRAGAAVLLKIHADKNLLPGVYTLAGKARLVIIHRGKSNEEKDVEVVIPITVVERNEVVALNSFPYQPFPAHRYGDDLSTILLIPIILPYLLFYVIACTIAGCSA